MNFRSGLKRGVFVHFNCLDSTCDHFEFELTTSCGGGGSAELPWVIECLSKSDPNFEICSLLHHDHSKRINQMSLNLQFTSHPQLDLFIGTKKIEVDQSTMAGNSLDIKVNPILLYYILDHHQVWQSHDPMSVQTFDFCEDSYPLFSFCIFGTNFGSA